MNCWVLFWKGVEMFYFDTVSDFLPGAFCYGLIAIDRAAAGTLLRRAAACVVEMWALIRVAAISSSDRGADGPGGNPGQGREPPLSLLQATSHLSNITICPKLFIDGKNETEGKYPA